jgi:hypothetical protein
MTPMRKEPRYNAADAAHMSPSVIALLAIHALSLAVCAAILFEYRRVVRRHADMLRVLKTAPPSGAGSWLLAGIYGATTLLIIAGSTVLLLTLFRASL